ncbi:MAG: type IV toxin-antitoxin system AbiEi family antitoxin domain-containing protein [Bryobacteraceae bacterium]
MPRTRFDELVSLAGEQDGLFTSDQARHAGFKDSVLARLTQRGRLERTARGVYRIPYIPLNRFSQYREAVLWAQSHRGPMNIALSHETALVAYGISDANPAAIHLTVPTAARLRREAPKAVFVHRADLEPGDIATVEGLPLTSIARTVEDLLSSGTRVNLAKQAIADARREGFISTAEAQRLRGRLQRYLGSLHAS